LFGGEAFPPSLRDWFLARGIDIYQCYATADVGLIAYETSARGPGARRRRHRRDRASGHRRPGPGRRGGRTGRDLPQSPVYPLVRFGTGDLSAVLAGTCPSGRTNTRIKGWMGRADQTTKIRGMFVHPGQVNEIAKRFPEWCGHGWS
jgi:phenylacetate-CoA ligase